MKVKTQVLQGENHWRADQTDKVTGRGKESSQETTHSSTHTSSEIICTLNY